MLLAAAYCRHDGVAAMMMLRHGCCCCCGAAADSCRCSYGADADAARHDAALPLVTPPLLMLRRATLLRRLLMRCHVMPYAIHFH